MATGRGQSLTPMERADEVADIGMWDGILSGVCAAIPSSVGVWYGMNYSPKFAKYTNWQSRTAMIIMPPLFMFGLSSEQKVNHRMREMAEEKAHSSSVTEWAEQQQKRREEFKKQREALLSQSTNQNLSLTSKSTLSNNEILKEEKSTVPSSNTLTEKEREQQLSELYKKGVENSGIRIVPGSSLGLHHRIANFWQENPFKILTALSVPTVGIIFKTRTSKTHLQFQSMVMHTRVLGQFSVILMLITLMGFKGYMDVNGKFVTETDAKYQVEEMKAARMDLLQRLRDDKDQEEYIKDLKIRAREERAKQREEEKKVKNEMKKKKRKEKKEREKEQAMID